VVVVDNEVRVLYAGNEVARHAQSALRRASVIERDHLVGIVGSQLVGMTLLNPGPPQRAELARDLREYEDLVGGGW
jgi:hypothetical protein